MARLAPTARNFLPRPPTGTPDVPVARARAFQSSSPFIKGVAEAALYCAHRTSTVSSCAFCEQGGHLAAPFLILLRPRVARAKETNGLSLPSYTVKCFFTISALN